MFLIGDEKVKMKIPFTEGSIAFFCSTVTDGCAVWGALYNNILAAVGYLNNKLDSKADSCLIAAGEANIMLNKLTNGALLKNYEMLLIEKTEGIWRLVIVDKDYLMIKTEFHFLHRNGKITSTY